MESPCGIETILLCMLAGGTCPASSRMAMSSLAYFQSSRVKNVNDLPDRLEVDSKKLKILGRKFQTTIITNVPTCIPTIDHHTVFVIINEGTYLIN